MHPPRLSPKRSLALSAAAVALLWAAQPPLGLWPLALVAVAAWLPLTEPSAHPPRRMYLLVWIASAVYWCLSLQGIRHAHPVMYACWIALGGYLAVYHVLFVAACRRCRLRRVPLWIAAPVTWVGLEWVRNYLLTGTSALMLGHAVADVPELIQVADLQGSYAVSFVLVAANVAIYSLIGRVRGWIAGGQAAAATVIAAALLVGTVLYGRFRLDQPPGEELATVALVQRNEHVEYLQDRRREMEIFRRYAEQSVESLRDAPGRVDAVVWPESMLTGGLPWLTAEPDTGAAAEMGVSPGRFREMVEENRRAFLARAANVQRALAGATGQREPPHVIGGCGVIRYGEQPQVYSGMVQIAPDSRVTNWYGKTHLVMFGEYVPLIGRIPGLRELLPPGLGLAVGTGPEIFQVDQTRLSPNICIETAVERVTINQVAELRDRGAMPDAVVTVTNDAWFQQSSVVAHHLRCAQLVAAGCRRPILSAANGGPTAWIDSSGRVVRRLPTDAGGAVLATPRRDPRESLYVRIGDWPAGLLGLLTLGILADLGVARLRQRRAARAEAAALGTGET